MKRLPCSGIGPSRLLVVACLLCASVASRAAAPQGRFVAGTGTVTDTATGLVWQRAVDSNAYTYIGAQGYCSGLSLGGFASGWRLPTVKELQSIVDVRTRSPAIDTVAFPSTPTAYFWTSTPLAGSPSCMWGVGSATGETTTSCSGMMGVYDAVRCVR